MFPRPLWVTAPLSLVPQEFLHYAVGSILVLIASIVGSVKSGGISVLVAGSVGRPAGVRRGSVYYATPLGLDVRPVWRFQKCVLRARRELLRYDTFSLTGAEERALLTAHYTPSSKRE